MRLREQGSQLHDRVGLRNIDLGEIQQLPNVLEILLPHFSLLVLAIVKFVQQPDADLYDDGDLMSRILIIRNGMEIDEAINIASRQPSGDTQQVEYRRDAIDECQVINQHFSDEPLDVLDIHE